MDFAAALHSELPWLRQLLLSREGREDGWFLPGYLEGLVEDHAEGRADRTAELGMAMSVELWRRLFLAGRLDLAEPPAREAG
jgi:hypothetical protein